MARLHGAGQRSAGRQHRGEGREDGDRRQPATADLVSADLGAFSDLLRIQPRAGVDLARIDPGATPGFDGGREAADAELVELHRELFGFQERLWAERTRAMLVVLQALDGGGKDGVIRNVFTAFNPQGTRVTGFGVPTEEELAHDFLWRIHPHVPGRGRVAIFNRSHYEEQRERFQKRLDNPEKRWKFSLGDLDVRAQWDQYMAAYADALSRCSTELAPWFVIPANRKWYRDLAVARIVTDAARKIDPQFPEPKDDLSAVVIPE